VHPSSPNDICYPTTFDWIHKLIPPFPHRLKRKDKAHVDKVRETLSQDIVNIQLLYIIQQMPLYANL